MIPQEFLDALAVRVLETWLMQQGLRPTGDWDSSDPACVRNHGPYRVWTVQAAAPDGVKVDRDALWRPFPSTWRAATNCRVQSSSTPTIWNGMTPLSAAAICSPASINDP